MRRILLLIFIFNLKFLIANSQSLPVSLGNMKSWKQTQNGIVVKTNNGSLQLEVFLPTVIRVFVSRNDSFSHFSYAVIAEAQKTNFKAEKNPDGILLSTDSIIVKISASPVRIFIFNKNQKLILADDSAFGTQWNGQQVWTFKKIFHGERFLGLGEKTGNLDHRGSAYVNWNTDFPAYETRTDPLYTSIPFYIGLHDSLMYGLYFDNSYKTYFNFGASNNRFSSFGADGGDMVYYVIRSF